MKKNYSLGKRISILLVFFVSLSWGQTNTFWSKATQNQFKEISKWDRKSEPKSGTFYQLDVNSLRNYLNGAPLRGSGIVSNTLINLPNPNGEMREFQVYEAPMMELELQQRHPEIRTYVGVDINNPASVVRFSLTPKGFHSMVLNSSEGMQMIDPYTKDGNYYLVYSKRDLPVLDETFECLFEGDDENYESPYMPRFNANDGTMRTYRLALACTIEYAAYHISAAGIGGGTLAQRKAAVLDAMVVTMNRVNGVYERDLSVTMQLIANNENIIFVDSDNFTNDNANALIAESQTVIDGTIGSANYDIGHTFSTGGGGLAGLGVVCVPGQKAAGITGSPTPVGDTYDIDYVAHEMGHQFGAPHTFNGSTGNCSGGNRTASNAYEPGSGSTIMAYAGICSPQNVQNFSDDYFHQKSLQMIWSNILSTATCASTLSTGNSVPTAEAGANYTIPVSTPYKLTGSSTDASPTGTSTHTYTWEQYDLGPAGVPTETTSSGPLVRSFPGTNNPTRYVPRLQDLSGTGGSTTWEKLVSIARPINYRLTVRDNDVVGGQTAVDFMSVSTTTAAGPFTVTSQATTGISWTPGTTETITWNVAGTTGNGVNTANVNVLLSTDGGLTYDTVLASNVPNDGSQDITVPNVASNFCRVMVEAVGNIFFDINSESFSIGSFTCNAYPSGNIAIPIPDGLGTTSPQNGTPIQHSINVTESMIINNNLKINVDVSHTYVGDLLVRVYAPDNTTYANLWAGDCSNNDNFNVTFSDGAPAIVCGSPTTGEFSPVDPLSVFNGMNTQGNWTILIADFYQTDTGTLNDWAVEICTPSLSNDEFDLSESLQIFPNPNNGEFTVKFLTISGQDDVNIRVSDIRGRIVYNNLFSNNGYEFNEVIRLENLQSGLYLVNVNHGGREITKKIVIE